MSIQQDWVMDSRSHRFPTLKSTNREVLYLLLLQNIYNDIVMEARAHMIKRINRLLDDEIVNLDKEIEMLKQELEDLNSEKTAKQSL